MIGKPLTDKLPIGSCEVRVAPMSRAMRQEPSDSVGLVDNASWVVSQQSVDKKGGFPKTLVASAIVEQSSEITATLSEYCRRNIALLLGGGVVESTADVATTVSASAVEGATALTVASATDIVAGSMVVAYPSNMPENVQVLRVASVATNTLTLDSDTPLLFDVSTGTVVFLAQPLAVGAVTQTQYFSVQLLQSENSTGRPIPITFWKCAIAGDFTMANNTEDFATTQAMFKCFTPSASEYAVGKPLAHVADLIPLYPTGFYPGGGG